MLYYNYSKESMHQEIRWYDTSGTRRFIGQLQVRFTKACFCAGV